MSKKIDIINKINSAKLKHLNWLSYAEKLYNGVKIIDKPAPVSHYDCEFGQWLENHGQFLYKIDQDQNIIKCHINVHEKCLEIYKLLTEQPASNIFNRSRINKKKQLTLEKKIISFKSTSKKLLDALDMIINKISAMNEKEINLYFLQHS